MKTPSCLVCLMVATTCFGAVAAPSQEGDNRVPQDVFNGMRESFRADQARGVHLRYQWDLSGPNGGQWWIEVNNGRYKMEHGQIRNPFQSWFASATAHRRHCPAAPRSNPCCNNRSVLSATSAGL